MYIDTTHIYTYIYIYTPTYIYASGAMLKLQRLTQNNRNVLPRLDSFGTKQNSFRSNSIVELSIQPNTRAQLNFSTPIQ